MPIRSASRLSRALDSLVDALTGLRSERAAAVVLVIYGLLWTAYGAISKASQDIHFDMGEAVLWSREAVLSNPKHPPLSAWPTWLWFHVFPAADWAYYLLSMTLATLALWA